MPPASAIGSDSKHTRPTSRGRVYCVSGRMGQGRALTAAGPRGRRCRQPEPWLRVHAPKPHEQGAWALRFVSDGAGEGVDGGRPARAAVPPARAVGSVFTRLSPTSRGLGRCVSFRIGRGREQTTAGPRAGACRLRGVWRRCLALWARGAAGMRGRRCLPCGQRRCRVARRIMACRGRERGFRSGLPIREIYQRAGERGNGPHPAGDGDTRHLADRTRPSPGTRAQPQLSKTFPRHLRLFHACLQPSRAHKSQLPTLPATASSPRPSRRENGGLCPHPLKGPDP